MQHYYLGISSLAIHGSLISGTACQEFPTSICRSFRRASLNYCHGCVDRNARNNGHGGAWEDGVKSIDWAGAVFAVKKHQVLDWLFALAQHIDDVLCQLAAQEGCDRRQLAAQVLKEASQDISPESFRREEKLLVLDVGNGGEELEVLRRVGRVNAMTVALVLPERTYTGEEWVHPLQPPGVVCNFAGQGRILGQHEWAVKFLFGDKLNDLSILPLDLDMLDASGCGFRADLSVAIALFTLNDKVVLDKVGEDVAVHAMGCAHVKRLLCYARACVEGRGGEKVHVGGYDDVVGSIEARILLHANVGRDDLDGDAWVELLDLGLCSFGAVLAYVGVADEEGRAQVFFCDIFVVGEGDGANAGEDEVLCDFVCEGFDGDKEDVCGADLLLGLDTPEADLAVVEGDFVCGNLAGLGNGSNRLASLALGRESAIGCGRRYRGGLGQVGHGV